LNNSPISFTKYVSFPSTSYTLDIDLWPITGIESKVKPQKKT
jgi:hypothetical protein